MNRRTGNIRYERADSLGALGTGIGTEAGQRNESRFSLRMVADGIEFKRAEDSRFSWHL